MRDNILFIAVVFAIPFLLKGPNIKWVDNVGTRNAVTYKVYPGKGTYILLVDGESAGCFKTEELAKEYAEGWDD